MKKIVIAQPLAFYAWNMRWGLAKALKQKGYSVIFISSSDQSISSEEQNSEQKDLYRKKIEEEFDYFEITIHRKGTNPLSDLQTLYEFYKAYKEIDPDVILHFTVKPNIYGTLAAKLLGKPVINNIAGLGTLFITQSPLTSILKQLYKFSQKGAYRIFFQNRDDQSLFLDNHLIEKRQTALLPGSGIDLQKFAPVNQKNNHPFRFLFIARLLKDKGIYEYIEAIKIIKKEYKEVAFQILGALDSANKTAISKEELTEWIEEGLIDYLGVSDRVDTIIAQANCVVLPSYREGTPRSLLEASSMEKPIVTTNVVGCKEVVDDGVNGYLCEVKNSQDLAQKLKKMLNLSEEERQIMGKRGREKMIREFDEQIVFDRYLRSIEEIIA
jgi:glycosyltransferase involved in cell wall biosynthesis